MPSRGGPHETPAYRTVGTHRPAPVGLSTALKKAGPVSVDRYEAKKRLVE